MLPPLPIEIQVDIHWGEAPFHTPDWQDGQSGDGQAVAEEGKVLCLIYFWQT